MKALKRNLVIALLLFISVITIGNNAQGASYAFTRNLSLGTSGDDVTALQQFLIAGGFLKTATSTGFFGSLTKTALGAWQSSAGISPSTGFFGSISREVAGRIQAQNVIVATTTANGSPVRLKIPKLNIDAGFQYTGIKSDGTMEIPNNVVDVGWFTGSPHPGDKGSAIITGHVAQIRGGVITKPGVFIDLNKLQAGDKLYVVNDKGVSITFTVREVRSYDPNADATDVFTSKDGGTHLNLITCEGTWNPAQLSYSQRLVVFADLTQ